MHWKIFGKAEDTTVNVEVGQVWREVDPRHPREVLVIEIGQISVWIYGEGNRYVPAARLLCGNRRTWAQLSRFNGKRGGYEFVRQADGRGA